MKPDKALILSILQNGLAGYTTAKQRGISSKDLFDSEKEIFELFGEFIQKGRLPSLEEIKLLKNVELTQTTDSLDLDTCIDLIANRTLATKLNTALGGIIDKIPSDPKKAREELGQLVVETSISTSRIESTNNTTSIEVIENRYLKAEEGRGKLLGLSSPWPSRDKVSLGIQPGEVSVVMAKRATGKCIAAGTICHDPVTGQERTIEQIVKDRRGQVYSWEPNKPIFSVSPDAYIPTGRKECLLITLASGRELTATPEHPLMTPNGWRRLDELKVGNVVATVKKLPSPLATEEFSQEGLENAYVLDRLHFEDKGVINPSAFSMSNKDLFIFLSGLKRPRVRRDIETTPYKTKSKKRALQIQHLLLRFGITSCVKMSSESDKGKGGTYEVCISSDTQHTQIERAETWTRDDNIWWDDIVSITSAGVQDVYDLTVIPSHCFVANDIIVHNTWLGLSWINHIWQKELTPEDKALVITMEMPPWQILQRLFAIHNKLDYQRFRSGQLEPDDRARFMDWCSKAKKKEQLTPEVIVMGSDVIRNVSDIAVATARYRPKIVFIDGFYILGKDSKKSSWERTVENIQGIKLDVAVNMNVPVITTTQLKGDVGKEDLDGEADDAAYAKAIGDYADTVDGLFADMTFLLEEKRVLRGMKAREFQPIDLLINFSHSRQDYSEIKVLNEDNPSDSPKMELGNLPDFEAGDTLSWT